MAEKRISISLPPELEAAINELANAHERSQHGEIVYAIKAYIKREKERAMRRNERLSVQAHWIEPGQGETGTSTVAFGFEEAQHKAQEMRQWVRGTFGVGCVVEIKPDTPDLDRKAFHGM